MIVKSLFALYRAPDFNAILYEPLHHKGRLVIPPSEPVKHINQQDFKFPLDGLALDFLDGVPFLCRLLKPGDSFFIEFFFDVPIRMAGDKFPAILLLHGNIVFFNLSHCGHSVQAVNALFVFHTYTPFFMLKSSVCALFSQSLYLLVKVHLTLLLSHIIALIANFLAFCRRNILIKQYVLDVPHYLGLGSVCVAQDNFMVVNYNDFTCFRLCVFHRLLLVK